MLLAAVLVTVLVWTSSVEAGPVQQERTLTTILSEEDLERFSPERRLSVRVVQDEAAPAFQLRSSQDSEELPVLLALRVQGEEHDVRFRLQRSPLLKTRVNMEEVRAEDTSLQDAAVYTDPSRRATLLVRRHSGNRFSMEGRWEHEDKELSIAPSAEDVNERDADGSIHHEIEVFQRHVPTDKPLSMHERSGPANVLELLYVTDYENYKLWKARKQDKVIPEMTLFFTFLAKDVQTRYANIKEVSLDVRGVGLEIATEASKSPWTNDLVNPQNPTAPVPHGQVLSNFKLWVKENQSKIPKADNYASFTSLSLGSGGVLGVAYMGTSCSYGSVSLTKTYPSLTYDARNFVHELGHNLGMSHTWDTDCTDASGYIMSYVDYHPSNWNFTACSIKSLQKHIENSPCITTKGGCMSLQTDKLPGQYLSVDQQCDMEAPGSTLDQSYFTTATYSKICIKMMCRGKDGGSFRAQPLEYTDCGTGRWCIQGQCVSKPV